MRLKRVRAACLGAWHLTQKHAEEWPIPSIFASVSREPCTHPQFLEAITIGAFSLGRILCHTRCAQSPLSH